MPYKTIALRRASEKKYRQSPKGKATISTRAKERRATDPEYAARCGERTADWRKRNPNYSREWKATNTARRLLYQAHASRHPCTVTLEDIVIPRRCPVLNILLDPAAPPRDPALPSLDRINNTLGYVPGNVQVVSWRANQLKRDATLGELIQLGKFARKLQKK